MDEMSKLQSALDQLSEEDYGAVQRFLQLTENTAGVDAASRQSLEADYEAKLAEVTRKYRGQPYLSAKANLADEFKRKLAALEQSQRPQESEDDLKAEYKQRMNSAKCWQDKLAVRHDLRRRGLKI